ncbi:hypothetical protein ILUMI_19960 [Ignelater luminosus]|uniref:Glucuronosyltransferase n=1 Tax=Ignelater luminosus TaxID=2038154 RepID=A0A8K0G5C2_IGNLU|nr:hypothetical protein ILUMI_19960 [Ignelater luminosus]
MKLGVNRLLLFISVTVITSAFSARILGVVPIPSYSHQVAFYPLWKELSLRGHQVTLITSHPIRDPSFKNLTEIDVSFMQKEWANLNPQESKKVKLSLFDMFDFLTELGYNLTNNELKDTEVQKLIKNENEHFDVALIETIFPGMALFAERFKCPLIQIFSLDGPTYSYYLFGNPVHPVLNPDFMLPFSGKLTFIERLFSTAYFCFTLFYNKYRLRPSQQAAAEKHFGGNYPDIEEILQGSSLMFVNTDNVFHSMRPLLPNVIQIGGGTHLSASKPLPKDLKKILDEATNGAIYFSLGGNIKSKDLPENTRKIFLETFSELPYTILWKFEQDDLPGKPDNVFISKWFPQQDIFRHPNIKLFISQGGLQSMDEATHNYIPIVGIPFFGDQENNVKRIINKGIGLGLSFSTLDKSSLKEAILEVANNPKYRIRVKELADLSKDQPMTGLERAVWWTEYVIRHKGAKHLKSPALDVPAYQYYLLDVIGFILAVISVVGYVFIKLVKLVLRFIKYLLPKSKVKVQ